MWELNMKDSWELIQDAHYEQKAYGSIKYSSLEYLDGYGREITFTNVYYGEYDKLVSEKSVR